MTAWATFWGAVLVLSGLALAILTLWVIAGGGSDIRALFESIEAQHADEPRGEDKG